jgi:hypothetical protein
MSLAPENVSGPLPNGHVEHRREAAATPASSANQAEMLFALGSRFGAVAECALYPQHRRWVLRLTVNGHYIRSQSCATREQAIAECGQWLEEMRRRGWRSETSSN